MLGFDDFNDVLCDLLFESVHDVVYVVVVWLFGALIVGVFSLGLRMIGTDPQWTYLLIGVLIISAVAIDQWIRKISV